jgi:hypothetical protein
MNSIEPLAEASTRSLLRETLETGRVIALAAVDSSDAWKADYLMATARRLHSTVNSALAVSPDDADRDSLRADAEALDQLLSANEPD